MFVSQRLKQAGTTQLFQACVAASRNCIWRGTWIKYPGGPISYSWPPCGCTARQQGTGRLPPARGGWEGGRARQTLPAGGLCSPQSQPRRSHSFIRFPFVGPFPPPCPRKPIPEQVKPVAGLRPTTPSPRVGQVHLRVSHAARIRLFVSHSLAHFPSASQEAYRRAGKTG